MNRLGTRLAGAVALATAAALVPLASPASGGEPLTRGGEVIVRYAPGTTGDERVQAREGAGVEFAGTLGLPRAQVVSPEPGQPASEAIDDLESDPNVLYAEPNYVEQLDLAPPNDPFTSYLWGLFNNGQTVNSVLGTPGADMKALAGWDIGHTSSNTITAVIDTGITLDHPDLASQIWTNPGETAGNGIDDDGNGFIDDVHGWDFAHGDNVPLDGDDHGTHTAGTIGATGNNGIGISGVSWDAELMPLQVCASVGGCPISNQINAIAYAAAMGARVANISIGGEEFSQARRDAIAGAPDILFSVSAGNDATGVAGSGNNEVIPKYPCQDDQQPGNPALGNIICVAASDQNDQKAAFSNYGSTSVDLAAPGVNIVSAYPLFSVPFTDDFETVASPWDHNSAPASSKWERVAGIGRHPNDLANTVGVTDNSGGNYLPLSNAAMTMNGAGVNLAGKTACHAEYWFKSDTDDQSGTLPTSDWFFVEASHDVGGPWTTIDAWRGSHLPDGHTFEDSTFLNSANEGSTADLVTYEGDASVYFRLRLQADADTTVGKGAVVDDFRVRCAEPSTGPGLYIFKSGTSMAAPQVSGLASIVRDVNPGLTVPEVKQVILSGVDQKPAFATAGSTPTVTGGRVNMMGTLSQLDVTPPPSPGIVSPKNGSQAWGNTRFSWSFGDPSAENDVVLDDVPLGLGGSGLSHAEIPLTPGRHRWRVTATDEAGNVSSSPTATFTYSKRPPISIVSANARRGRRGGASVKVRVPGAGTVILRAFLKGKLVGKAAKKANGARTVTINMSPNGKGRKLLSGSRGMKVIFRATFNGWREKGNPGRASRSGRFAGPKR